MHKISRDLLIVGSLLTSLFSFVACENPDLQDVNLGGQNDKLDGIFTDELPVGSLIEREEDVNAIQLNRHMLGHLKDPVFGETEASFVTQIRLAGNNIDFGESLSLDSVVLSLKYLSYYGDTTASFKVLVHELDQDIEIDSAYTSKDSFAVKPTLLADTTITPSPNDSVNILRRRNGNDDTLARLVPQIRIKLDNSFGQSLLDQSGGDNFADNEAFMNWFKGLKVEVDPTETQNEGGLIILDILNSASNVTLYYKQDTIKREQQFLINSFSATAVQYKHDYTGSDVQNTLDNNTEENNRLYLQPMAGINAEITFPFLDSLRALGPIAINKAELVLTVEPGTNDNYSTPGKLLLFSEDSTGTIANIPDAALGELYRGGFYNPEDEVYKFNIGIFLQDLLDGKAEGKKLKLVPDARVIFPQRVVLWGQNSPDQRIKLNLVYTPLDN